MDVKYVNMLVIAVAAIAVAEGAVYTVGDGLGWTVPPTPDYYASWVSKHYFVANDTIVFNFEQGKHDITVLGKEDFDACNMDDPMFQTPEPGAVSSESPGTLYFTCSFADHCARGQKFAIYFASEPMPAPSPCPSPTNSATSTHQSPTEESRLFKFVPEKMLALGN